MSSFNQVLVDRGSMYASFLLRLELSVSIPPLDPSPPFQAFHSISTDDKIQQKDSRHTLELLELAWRALEVELAGMRSTVRAASLSDADGSSGERLQSIGAARY